MAAISFSYGCFSGFISRICLPEDCMTVVVRVLSRKKEVLVLAGQPGLRRPVQKWWWLV
jgi:hypothetical protein